MPCNVSLAKWKKAGDKASMQTSLPASSRCVCVRVATVFVVAEEGVNEHQKSENYLLGIFFSDDEQFRSESRIFQ